MYGVVYTTKFSKDVKLAKKQGKDKAIKMLEEVIKKIQNGEKLDVKFRDHKLNDNNITKKGSRGCHILFDLVLVYRIEDNIVYLDQFGDHHTLRGWKESLNNN